MTSTPVGWERWQGALSARVEQLVAGRSGLDEETRRRAALVIVDDMAAMVAARGEEPIRLLSEAGSRIAPSVEALHVTGARSGRSWAAMVNAVAANWNELDEGYRPATCHGGLYALPAAMAEVEASGGTVGDLMISLVAGYEVVTAFARAFPPPRPLALHPHASLSPVGAAAAVAAARRESGPGVMAAANVAVTLAAAGPFSHATSGVMARNGWAGVGAQSGFAAVELATAGITAATESPVAVLHEALGYPADPRELESPPTRWAIHDGYHKSYACCQYAHSAVEATLSLVNGPLAGVPAERMQRVIVETHPLAMALDDVDPRTVLGGKFSLPHTVAAVLTRASADMETFSGALLDDEGVARLRSAVDVVPYSGNLAPPFDRPARVTVIVEGQQYVAECLSAVGGPDRPLSEQDVLDKAELLTAGMCPRFSSMAADLVAGRMDAGASWRDVVSEMWSP